MRRLATAAWAALALCLPLSAGAEESSDEARQQYDRGVELEEAGDLVGALEAFSRAQQLRPTFRLRRHMGRVCLGLRRYREALDHLQAFLSEGGERVEAPLRQEAQAAIAEARRHLATVTITAPEGATLSIDGATAGRAPLAGPVLVDEGRRRIEARLEGHGDGRRELDLVGGATIEVDIPLEPLPAEGGSAGAEGAGGGVGGSEGPPSGAEPAGLPPALFWSAAAVTAAALVTGAVLGGLALSQEGDFDELNRADRTDAQEAELQDLRASGEAMGIGADVLLFGGAALAVGTLVLAFFTDFGGAPAGAARLRPTFGPGTASLAFEGRF